MEQQTHLTEVDHSSRMLMSPPVRHFFQKWKVDNREKLLDWYRKYFHTVMCSLLIVINVILAISGVILYFSHWKHKTGDPDVFLSNLFDHPPGWLTGLLHLIYAPIDKWGYWWWWFINTLPWITWAYSTITRPIRKGYKDIMNYKSRKGRIRVVILLGICFAIQFCAFNAWNVDVLFYPGLARIHVDKDFLVIKGMESFVYVLMLVPLIACFVATFQVLRQVFMYDDLRKLFFTWEFSLFARFSNPIKLDRCDVVVGWEVKTKKPVVIAEGTRFLHEMIAGTTGSGKTSTSLLIRIVQDLIRIARGYKMGVVLLEPKGDAIRDVLKLAKKLGIPDEKILVVDPTDLVRSIKFNPFAGPLESVSENFRGVLDALAGDQDEFFKGQQSETAAAYTRLGKIRYSNMFTLSQMRKMYIDPRYLADVTEEVRAWITEMRSKDLQEKERKELDGYDSVCQYFEKEVLEYKTYRNKDGDMVPQVYGDNHEHAGKQVVESKKDKYVTGAKKYLNEITMNAMLSELMVPQNGDKCLDIDEFLDKGGLLLVNSALGELDELSLLFGQFFIRQFQSAVFRRPPEENDYKRAPVFFTIDEFPLYANPSFERMLTLGRSYKVGSVIAIQSLGQLERVEQGYDKVIWSNARTKTCFGGGTFDDNKRFSDQFGEEYIMEESMNESTTPVTMPNQKWGYRHNTQRTLTLRYTPTDIQELPFKHFIIQMVDEDNNPQPPVSAVGSFVNETNFLKKFMDIGNIELETKKHRALRKAEFYSTLIGKVLFENSIPIESNSTVITDKDKPETVPSMQNQQPDTNQHSDKDEEIIQRNNIPDQAENLDHTEGTSSSNTNEHHDQQEINTANNEQQNPNSTEENPKGDDTQSLVEIPKESQNEKNPPDVQTTVSHEPNQKETNSQLENQSAAPKENSHQSGQSSDPLLGLRNDKFLQKRPKENAVPVGSTNQSSTNSTKTSATESTDTHSIPSPEAEKAINELVQNVQPASKESNTGNETSSTNQKRYAAQNITKVHIVNEDDF